MTIRDAQESDVDGIAATHIASWRVAYRDLLPKDVLDNLSHKARCDLWRQVIAKQTSMVIVAIDGDQITGFLCSAPARDADLDRSHVAEILACYVHPDAWRRGIGSRLWNEARQRLGGRFSDVVLWTWRDNALARRFYERIGFVFDGTDKLAETYGAALVEVRYRRSLAAGAMK